MAIHHPISLPAKTGKLLLTSRREEKIETVRREVDITTLECMFLLSNGTRIVDQQDDLYGLATQMLSTTHLV